jgi:hypothetical protein
MKKLALVSLIAGMAFAAGLGAVKSGVVHVGNAQAAAQKAPKYPHLESPFAVIATGDWLDLTYDNYVQPVRLRYGKVMLNCILFNHDQSTDATGASFSCPDKINP